MTQGKEVSSFAADPYAKSFPMSSMSYLIDDMTSTHIIHIFL